MWLFIVIFFSYLVSFVPVPRTDIKLLLRIPTVIYYIEFEYNIHKFCGIATILSQDWTMFLLRSSMHALFGIDVWSGFCYLFGLGQINLTF